MKKINKGFTLVELLVVITIIAILGVVAYTQFGGATDKAKAAAKGQNIEAIKGALEMYKNEKGFYPKPANKDTAKNIWGYDNTTNPEAKKTCETGLSSDADGKITGAINTTNSCGGIVKDTSNNEIGAKGTLGYSGDIKKYLKKDAYDSQIGDIEFNSAKLIDSGIGRFPYAIYANGISNNNKNGSEYNIAYTIKDKDGKETTKILGGFNDASCSGCPNSLIGSKTDGFINDGDTTDLPYKLDF